jgi:DNA invertase Pin-like site-specific DNA recombinase
MTQLFIGDREIILCIDETGDKKKGKTTDYTARSFLLYQLSLKLYNSFRLAIGYARVSTSLQSLDLQIDAWVQAGCDKKRIFTDIASGSKTARPGLDKVLDYAREGDILVVWKLDRLGRSLGHLIEVVRGLSDRSIGFKSIQESLDTTTSGGRLIFHVFGAIAEFERDLIRDRTNAGSIPIVQK